MPKKSKKKVVNNLEKKSEKLILDLDDDKNYTKKYYLVDDLQKAKIDKSKMKFKDKDELKVVESVLDVEISNTLFNLRKRKIIDQMTGIISTGKEANVYHGYAPDGSELAIKIYRTSTNIFKGLQIYILGDTRFANIKKDQRSFVYAWARKEFKNLMRATEAKVSVPRPIFCLKDVLVMEFIGKNGLPYRLIKDEQIIDPKATYKEVWINIEKLYKKAGLIHADLSEYNIMYTPKIYFIDISQGVLLDHPMAEIFLLRDLKNITRYFKSQNVQVQNPELLFEKLVGEPPSEKVRSYNLY